MGFQPTIWQGRSHKASLFQVIIIQILFHLSLTSISFSRNVSAEIFVVCRDFLAPKHIDPKFLDPKHVFKDLAATLAPGESGMSIGTAESNVFHPEKKRRHRDGYADGDYTLFKSLPASSFIRGNDSISFLGSVNKITFLTEEEKEQDTFYLVPNILLSYR